ncbi:MAG: hypothetical protein WD042_08190 [Phycisphaeraceae bacterium]
MKPAIFHPAALATIRAFPDQIKRAVGEAILKLQHGAMLKLPLSRLMPTVTPGVAELRVKAVFFGSSTSPDAPKES